MTILTALLVVLPRVNGRYDSLASWFVYSAGDELSQHCSCVHPSWRRR